MTYPHKIVFKVTYGYRPTDFVLVHNTVDLQKAIYAKVERIPVTLDGKVISGNEIKVIEPDVHSYTGWHRTYQPLDGSDFAQLERDVPKVLGDIVRQATQHINELVGTGRTDLVGMRELPKLKEIN